MWNLGSRLQARLIIELLAPGFRPERVEVLIQAGALPRVRAL